MRRLVLLASVLVVAACSSAVTGASSSTDGAGGSTDLPGGWSGRTINVPRDHPGIQAAVDAAEPGDLILIDPGVYPEQVDVTTAGLTIRGEDRNGVVIDGQFVRPHGISVFADGVAIENLTVRNAAESGIVWTGVRGYRGSYLTAVDNVVYGIGVSDSIDGLVEHSYASGSAGAGYFVSACDPCEVVITDSVAEGNGRGFSGVNASGDIYVVDSTWRHNAAGIVSVTSDADFLAPVHHVTIAGNLVHDNGNPAAPFLSDVWAGFGNGILLAGGRDSVIAHNTVVDHPENGVAVSPAISAGLWISAGNRVTGNHIRGSGRADIALAGPAGPGNCFEGNRAGLSLPAGLEVFQPCDGPRLPMLYEMGGSATQLGRMVEAELGLLAEARSGQLPEPGPQPQLPRADSAPGRPAVGVFVPPDIAKIEIPELPADMAVDTTRGVTVFGVSFASIPGAVLGFYGYVLPVVLYAAWVGIALWDLVRREVGKVAFIVWTVVILLVPFVGVIAYHLFSRSPIPLWQRLTYVLGGVAAYLIVLGAGLLAGGAV